MALVIHPQATVVSCSSPVLGVCTLVLCNYLDSTKQRTYSIGAADAVYFTPGYTFAVDVLDLA